MTDGEITYGYKTRDTEKEFDVLGVKLFDFSDIDFTKFTLRHRLCKIGYEKNQS